jgi:prepilin-type N-terminal cleavage/methylation domain-containing protein
MKTKFSIFSFQNSVSGEGGSQPLETENLKLETCRAFTLLEVLVVIALLSFIVLALMAVFSNTEAVLRSNLTQGDVLGSGRAVMDLISRDLETMAPSDGNSNNFNNGVNYPAVNFAVTGTNGDNVYPPLLQSLPGSSVSRTNVLENFFILGRDNVNGAPSWTGAGYAVVEEPAGGGLYSLYRFTTAPPYPAMSFGPEYVFYANADNNIFYPNRTNNFQSFLAAPTNYSHLVDGVVELRVRAYDAKGYLMNGTLQWNGTKWVANTNVYSNTSFFTLLPPNGENGFYFYSNALPASVEVELGLLENRVLQHAEAIDDPTIRSNYLAQHAGQVHVFRQRFWIRNFDPSAYQ